MSSLSDIRSDVAAIKTDVSWVVKALDKENKQVSIK
jgi:hypothetical protein